MRTEEAIAKAEESPVEGTPVPERPVLVIADGAFKDRGRLINHFEDVEFRFADVSDPAKLSEATAGASGIVVTLQPMRAAHIGALAPSVRVIGRAGVGLNHRPGRRHGSRYYGPEPADLRHKRSSLARRRPPVGVTTQAARHRRLCPRRLVRGTCAGADEAPRRVGRRAGWRRPDRQGDGRDAVAAGRAHHGVRPRRAPPLPSGKRRGRQ